MGSFYARSGTLPFLATLVFLAEHRTFYAPRFLSHAFPRTSAPRNFVWDGAAEMCLGRCRVKGDRGRARMSSPLVGKRGTADSGFRGKKMLVEELRTTPALGPPHLRGVGYFE